LHPFLYCFFLHLLVVTILHDLLMFLHFALKTFPFLTKSTQHLFVLHLFEPWIHEHLLFFETLHFVIPFKHFLEPATAFPFKITVVQHLLLKQFFPTFAHLHVFLFCLQSETLLHEVFILFQNFKACTNLNLQHVFVLHFFDFVDLHLFLVILGHFILLCLHCFVTCFPLFLNTQQIFFEQPFLNFFTWHFLDTTVGQYSLWSLHLFDVTFPSNETVKQQFFLLHPFAVLLNLHVNLLLS